MIDSPARAKAFTAICQKMRNDTKPKPDKVKNEDMHFLLFGMEPDGYFREKK